MNETGFSIIIPAHNEEKYIGKCLEAIKKAADVVTPCSVRTIVVANRCTDSTAEIAKNTVQRSVSTKINVSAA